MQLKKIQTTTAFQIFQVARAVTMIGISIALAKSGIVQSDIGIYEKVILVTGSLSFFWVNAYLTTFLRRYTKSRDKKDVLANTVFLFVITLLCCFFLFYIFQRAILSAYTMEAAYFPLFIVFFLFNSIGFITEYILLAREKTRGLILLGVFHLIVQSLAVALPAFTSADINDVILGLIVFSTIKFTVLVFVYLEAKPGVVYAAEVKAQLAMASPLMISFFLGGIAVYADALIVNYYYDKSTFAIFQYGAKELPVALLLANGLSITMLQKITADTMAGMQELKRRSLRLMHLLFPLSIILIATSKYLYPLIFNSQFTASALYFNIYLLLLIPRMIFPQTVITASGNTRVQLYISLAEFVLNVAVSLVLLRFIGLPGVAAGTVIAYLFEKTAYIIYLKKKNIHPASYIPIKNFLFYSFILLLAFVIFTF